MPPPVTQDLIHQPPHGTEEVGAIIEARIVIPSMQTQEDLVHETRGLKLGQLATLSRQATPRHHPKLINHQFPKHASRLVITASDSTKQPIDARVDRRMAHDVRWCTCHAIVRTGTRTGSESVADFLPKVQPSTGFARKSHDSARNPSNPWSGSGTRRMERERVDRP
jgi:hypothetical protein